MRRGIKILIGAIIGIPVLLVAAFICLGLIVMPDCGPDSPAVTRALALSQAELANLYKEMSLLAQREPHTATLDPESIPEAIRDLDPRFVHVATGPRITLEGCLDHYVIMMFYGLPGQLGSDREPSIVLEWGEGPGAGSKVLWSPDS